MSKYKFKITYRNENEYGQYWGDNRYTVSIIAETLEQAKQKLDEIEKNGYGVYKNILEWEAEEINEKEDEIERLNNLLKETSQTLSEQTTKAITLKSENERLNNIINEIRKQLDYLETYSSKEDVFEDMKRRLDKIDKIIGSDKE